MGWCPSPSSIAVKSSGRSRGSLAPRSIQLRVQSTSPTHYVARNVRCNFFFNPLNTLAVYRNSATARLLVTVVYMYTMACT